MDRTGELLTYQGMQEDISRTLDTHLPSELDAAIQWLDQLGIAYSQTRFGRYKLTLDRLESARVTAESARIKVESALVKEVNLYDIARRLNAFAPLFEANELAMIHAGLSGRGLGTYLRPRLEELVAGPESYVDESAARPKARNTGFELAVIARLATAGLIIQQDENLADVVARLGNTIYVVECKRPQSEAGVYDAIRGARKQLDTRYLQMDTANATGFIALDLTKVFNPTLSVTDDMSAHEMVPQINTRMRSLLRRHIKDWERVKDDRTAGILLRHSELAWIESNKRMSLFHKYAITHVPGRSPARRVTVTAVEEALNRALLSEGTLIT